MKILIHSTLACLILLSFFTASAQNGRYDLRFDIHEVDCADSTLYVDVEIKATSDTNHFNLAGANYRFSFNRAAIDSPMIAQELTISGFIFLPGGAFTAYFPHTLTGSVDTVVSYNVAFSAGPGYPITDTAWVEVGRLSFRMLDFYQCLDLRWHTKDPLDFPNTIITEVVGITEPQAQEGGYTDGMVCFFDSCDVNDPPIAVDDMVNTLLATPVMGNVLPNDSDPEMDSLYVTNFPVVQPLKGSASIGTTGNFIYTPGAGFAGKDSFKYQLWDTGIPPQSDEAWVFINIDSCGSPSQISDPGLLCPGDTVTIMADAVAGATLYNWTATTGLTVLSGQGTNALTVVWGSIPGQLCISAVSGGCSSSFLCRTFSPELLPDPLTAVSGPSEVCPGEVYEFSVFPDPKVDTYHWTVPGDWSIQSGAGTNLISVLSGSMTGEICVYAESVCETTNTQCLSVSIRPAVEAAFSYSQSLLTIMLSDSSKNTQNWLWDFGDGQGSVLQNTDHTYALAGTYSVCLTVADTCGSDSVCAQITVEEPVIPIDTLPPGTFTYFPNPAHDYLLMEMVADGNWTGEIEVIDDRGRRVSEDTWSMQKGVNRIELDVRNFSSAIYVLRIRVGEREWIEKFLVGRP